MYKAGVEVMKRNNSTQTVKLALTSKRNFATSSNVTAISIHPLASTEGRAKILNCVYRSII